LCGIAGIFGRGAQPDTVRRMCDTIRHRGPDDEGYYAKDGIALGSVRLSIIDLKTGRQPIHNEDSTIWIMYNGEIFNYRELRKDLETRHRFLTNSDTEVIVHLYEELGTKCVQKLNGMFAFAIWNEKTRELFLARDRIGVKPLYYYGNENDFVFASEIKAILEFGAKRELDHEAFIDYLTLSYVLGDKTFFKGIRQLPAGHFMTVNSDRHHIERYWDLEFEESSPRGTQEAIVEVNEAIKRAVELRLVSDVPLGCHLSGGIDSTAVTSFASQLLGEKVKTFTGAFSEGPEFDETYYARLASKFADTEYHEIRPDGTDLLPTLERLVWYMDYPEAGPGIYPQYWVCCLAKEHVKVILGGQGGDELFFGYPFMLELALENNLIRTRENFGLGYLVKLYHYFRLAKRERPFTVSLRRLGRMILKEHRTEPSRLLYEGMLVHSHESVTKLLTGELRRFALQYSPESEFLKIFEKLRSKRFLDQIQYCFLRVRLHALLHVEDRTSMAVSLESRVPLSCDYPLLELVTSLPEKLRIDGFEPKYLFRKAIDGEIPNEILQRKDKKGFPTPIGIWLRKQIKEVDSILLSEKAVSRGIFDLSQVKKILGEHESGRKDHAITIFMLLNLEFWFRRFIDAASSV
jgi:asparagine synthase (glutamine-hydrolysing)